MARLRPLLCAVLCFTTALLGCGHLAAPVGPAGPQPTVSAMADSGQGGNKEVEVNLSASPAGFQTQSIEHRWVSSDVTEYDVILTAGGQQLAEAKVLPKSEQSKAIFTHMRLGVSYTISATALGNPGGNLSAQTSVLNAAHPATASISFSGSNDIDNTTAIGLNIQLDDTVFAGQVNVGLATVGGAYDLSPGASESGAPVTHLFLPDRLGQDEELFRPRSQIAWAIDPYNYQARYFSYSGDAAVPGPLAIVLDGAILREGSVVGLRWRIVVPSLNFDRFYRQSLPPELGSSKDWLPFLQQPYAPPDDDSFSADIRLTAAQLGLLPAQTRSIQGLASSDSFLCEDGPAADSVGSGIILVAATGGLAALFAPELLLAPMPVVLKAAAKLAAIGAAIGAAAYYALCVPASAATLPPTSAPPPQPTPSPPPTPAPSPLPGETRAVPGLPGDYTGYSLAVSGLGMPGGVYEKAGSPMIFMKNLYGQWKWYFPNTGDWVTPGSLECIGGGLLGPPWAPACAGGTAAILS